MDATIITAIGAIVGAVISGIVAVLVANKQHDATIAEVNAKHNETIAIIEYRLKELEKKQDVHNNLITRMTAVETKINMYHGKEVANGAK